MTIAIASDHAGRALEAEIDAGVPQTDLARAQPGGAPATGVVP